MPVPEGQITGSQIWQSPIQPVEHGYASKSQGINSGLCDCGFDGENISSDCICGERHSWCENCWGKNDL